MSINQSGHVGKDAGSMTKIERYKWTLTDEPGTLCYIDKHMLHVEEAYQRKALAEKKILRMAAAWSWVACGAITVGKREDIYHVIDGQNRVLAAKRRSDVERMPCIVFLTTDIKQEAAGFVAANTNRKPMSYIDRHRALIVMGDPLAIKVQELISQSGRSISRSSTPYTISCLAMLTKQMGTYETDLRRLWPLILALCKGHLIIDRMVEGLMYIETRMPSGTSLTDRRWHDRMLIVGFESIYSSLMRSASFYARGGARVFAEGIAQAVNVGLRHKLEYGRSESEAA